MKRTPLQTKMLNYKQGLERKGKSLSDLANESGFHFSAIYRLYNGSTKNPQADTMDKIELAVERLTRKVK